jgi:hypothetical protein
MYSFSGSREVSVKTLVFRILTPCSFRVQSRLRGITTQIVVILR